MSRESTDPARRFARLGLGLAALAAVAAWITAPGRSGTPAPAASEDGVAGSAAAFLSLLDDDARAEGRLRPLRRGALQLGLHARVAQRPPAQGHDAGAAQRGTCPPPGDDEQPGVPQGQRDHRTGTDSGRPGGPSRAPRSRGLLRHDVRHARPGRALGVALRGPPPVAQLLVPEQRAHGDGARVHGGESGAGSLRAQGGVASPRPRGGHGARPGDEPHGGAARGGADRGGGRPATSSRETTGKPGSRPSRGSPLRA